MSSKTPREQENATESAPKKRNPLGLWFGAALVFFGIFAVVNGIVGLTDNKTRLIAPDGIITVETVNTPELRTLGLSGRQSLGNNEGMLFVFDEPSISYCFWMKDMNFSLDMIWLTEDKKVINIARNVSPDTYPDENFCPEAPAKYVLEVNANRAMELGISPGVDLRF